MNDETKLSNAEEFGNYAAAMSWPITAVAVVQWTITGWLAQYKHAKRRGKPFRLQMPHKLSVLVTGGRAGNVIESLRDYGVSCQETSSFMAIENGVKGMVLNFLVSAAQWEMADALLAQGGDCLILSAPGSKRGASFGQPWGVGSKARSFDEAIGGAIGNMFKSERKSAKPAKLGKPHP